MLSLATRNTAKLVRAKSKSDNVRLGRFFTKKETAKLMAGMISLDTDKTAYTRSRAGIEQGKRRFISIDIKHIRHKPCGILFREKSSEANIFAF